MNKFTSMTNVGINTVYKKTAVNKVTLYVDDQSKPPHTSVHVCKQVMNIK